MSSLRYLFASVVFLASFLLFLVEPIAARQLLPILGGSAAVWITCLVFFQVALLLGYLYAHWLAHRPSFVMYLSLLLLAVAAAVLSILRPLVMENGAFHFWFSARRVRCCRFGGRALKTARFRIGFTRFRMLARCLRWLCIRA
jgi:hypothetical protein